MEEKLVALELRISNRPIVAARNHNFEPWRNISVRRGRCRTATAADKITLVVACIEVFQTRDYARLIFVPGLGPLTCLSVEMAHVFPRQNGFLSTRRRNVCDQEACIQSDEGEQRHPIDIHLNSPVATAEGKLATL